MCNPLMPCRTCQRPDEKKEKPALKAFLLKDVCDSPQPEDNEERQLEGKRGGHMQAWPRRWPLPTSGRVAEMIMKQSDRGGSHAAALGAFSRCILGWRTNAKPLGVEERFGKRGQIESGG